MILSTIGEILVTIIRVIMFVVMLVIGFAAIFVCNIIDMLATVITVIIDTFLRGMDHDNKY